MALCWRVWDCRAGEREREREAEAHRLKQTYMGVSTNHYTTQLPFRKTGVHCMVCSCCVEMTWTLFVYVCLTLCHYLSILSHDLQSFSYPCAGFFLLPEAWTLVQEKLAPNLTGFLISQEGRLHFQHKLRELLNIFYHEVQKCFAESFMAGRFDQITIYSNIILMMEAAYDCPAPGRYSCQVLCLYCKVWRFGDTRVHH